MRKRERWTFAGVRGDGMTASSLWKVVNRRGIRALIGIVICGHPIIANAQSSGVSSIGRFARVLHRDVDAVKNAITEKWSNGQAEGQINRRKTLKRAMYGRAGVELRALACSPSHNPRARKVTQTPIKYSATEPMDRAIYPRRAHRGSQQNAPRLIHATISRLPSRQ